TLEGVPLGKGRGRVTIDAKAERETLAVAVKVPDFHLALPPSIGKSAEALDPNDNIVIIPPIAPAENRALPKSDGMPIAVAIDLGDIQIEGKGIDVTLTSDERRAIKIIIDERSEVAGAIKILRGRVEVLGKVFELEPGSLVNLRPEAPSNPFLNI